MCDLYKNWEPKRFFCGHSCIKEVKGLLKVSPSTQKKQAKNDKKYGQNCFESIRLELKIRVNIKY